MHLPQKDQEGTTKTGSNSRQFRQTVAMNDSHATGGISNKDWARLIVLSLLWGGSFLFIALALRELPILVIVISRLALGAMLLTAFVLATGRSMPTSFDQWRACAFMGLGNNVLPFSLFTFSQTVIPSGTAAILNAMTPIMTALVLHFATTDERLTRNKVMGVLLGFAGVVCLIGPSALGGLNSSVLGILACLLATICYAFSALLGRRLQVLVPDPYVSAASMLTASSLIMLPFVLALHPVSNFTMPNSTTLLAIFGSAALATALAYVIFYQILQSAGASNLMLVTFLIPISALLMGILFLGESLTLSGLGGMALIGLGLAATDGRALAWFRHKAGA